MTEQVQEIAKHAIHQTLGNSVYNREKVNVWCGQIVDACLKELAKLNKPFKYVGTIVGGMVDVCCSIVAEKRGKGLDGCSEICLRDKIVPAFPKRKCV